MRKRILSIGQCYADHCGIAHMLEKHFGAVVTGADTAREAAELAAREPFDLVLVNRLLDTDGSCGTDIIRNFKSRDDLKHLPVMLVSNYDDAQNEAVGLGALSGFGKASLAHPQTLARIGKVLENTSSS
jgi:CheY-like chemotaxis protein